MCDWQFDFTDRTDDTSIIQYPKRSNYTINFQRDSTIGSIGIGTVPFRVSSLSKYCDKAFQIIYSNLFTFLKIQYEAEITWFPGSKKLSYQVYFEFTLNR